MKRMFSCAPTRGKIRSVSLLLFLGTDGFCFSVGKSEFRKVAGYQPVLMIQDDT